MAVQRLRSHGVDVPRQVHKQLQVVGCHFGVVHVGHPQPPRLVVVGLAQFLVDESRLGSRQPQVVVGPPPVAQVVVYARTPAAPLLGVVAEARQVSVVVVTPHQRDVVRHAESVLVDVQHLFIRYEDLRHPCDVLADMPFQQLALVVDDLLQRLRLLLQTPAHALHGPVVDAPHADGVQILAALALAQSFGPVLVYGLAVGHVVKASPLLDVPLAHVVAQHGFAM